MNVGKRLNVKVAAQLELLAHLYFKLYLQFLIVIFSARGRIQAHSEQARQKDIQSLPINKLHFSKTLTIVKLINMLMK